MLSVAVLLKQKGVVLVDQPAQVRPLGEQGLSVRPPDGEEDLRVVGVPHDRFHGDGHAVVGVAGLDDLCPVLDDLGLRGGGDAKQGGKGRHRGLKGPEAQATHRITAAATAANRRALRGCGRRW